MFEHVRAAWTADMTQAQTAVAAATTAHATAQADLATRQAALAARKADVDATAATLATRNAALATAQALVDIRTAERQAAQAVVDQSQAALVAHLEDEPPETVERDKPNPAWGVWDRKREQLAEKLSQAESARDTTVAPQTAAQQSRDTAAAAAGAATTALGQARGTLAVAQADVAAATQRVVAAQATVLARQDAAAAVASRLAGLDARAAALLDEPLDRAALERAADAELADLHAAWARRHDLLAARGAAEAELAAVLAAHDQTMDELVVLRASIASSPHAGHWPAVAGTIPAIDAVLATNHLQRGRPALERADDLSAARQRLAELVVTLETVKAREERDAAQLALDQAVAALSNHQKTGP